MEASWVASIVLLTLPLGWLFWLHKTGRGEPGRSGVPSYPERRPADERSQVFRVCKIPIQYDGQTLKEHLQRLLSVRDDELSICSLAFDALDPQTKTATVQFKQIPERLQGSPFKTSWELEIEVVDTHGLSMQRYLLFDTEFLGLTTLASPSNDEHRADIIAVHGLGGHAFESFRQQQGDYMWLRDSLPGDVDGARVMMYGHDSQLHQSNSFQDLEALARTFGESLQAVYPKVPLPKVFIGHSLGGLIIKQWIIQMHRWKDPSHLLEATRGMLFFGVPSQGMDIESLLPMVEGQANELFLQSLGPHSQLLREQCERFNDAIMHRNLDVICYYETKQSRTAQKSPLGEWKMEGPFKILVSDTSARHGRGWETGSNVGAVDKSHPNLVKFERKDEVYHRVLHRLRELVDVSHHGEVPVRDLTSTEQDCLRSLSFPEMNNRKNDISKPTHQTCEWIFSHPKFQEWQRSNTGLLWIKGKPGSGKSTLFKHVLEHLQERPQNRLLILSFLFHGRGAEMERTPLGMFRSLSHQLFRRMPNAFRALVELHNERRKTLGAIGEGWAWHAQEIQDYFERAVAEALGTISINIMIDALDECGERDARAVIATLQRMASYQTTGFQVSVCFTCRHYPILTLQDVTEICTEDQNRSDIERYVDEEFQKIHSTPNLPDVRQKICERAEGVFQWATLVMKRTETLLQRGYGAKAILKEIETIPPDLAVLYQNLFQMLGPDERDEALRLMCWISYSTRPMELSELRFAMVLSTDGPPLSIQECRERDDFVEDDQRMKIRLTHLSCGLAETRDSGDGMVVQFIHQSVQDFITERGIDFLRKKTTLPGQVSQRNIHVSLARACIHCIALEGLRLEALLPKHINGILNIVDEHRISKVPFVDYAVEELIEHLKLAQDLQEKLLEQNSDLDRVGLNFRCVFTLWLLLYRRARRSFMRPTTGSKVLHIFSKHGLVRFMSDGKLEEFCDELNSVDDDGRTALSYAADKGHNAVVKQLLDTGKVDVDARDDDGRTPLSWAAGSGHDAVVKQLLDTGMVDVDARDNDDRTPLSWAAEEGNDAVVKQLLDTGRVDVDSRDNDGRTPLLLAAGDGNDAVVKQLLDTGRVDVDARDNDGRTPLSWAASYGTDVVVRQLVDTGRVDVDARDNDGRTPLSWAAEEGNDAVVKQLLDTGRVDVDSRDNDGRTPLLLAAGDGNDAVVKQLLDTGRVDVDARDNDGRTPLLWAALYGTDVVVRQLVDTGRVDVDARDNDGRTPLSWAAGSGNDAVVKQLLDTGRVDVDMEDSKGRTAVERARDNNHETVVDILVEYGARLRGGLNGLEALFSM